MILGMSTPKTETLEQWAARTAPLKTTAEWGLLNAWCGSIVGDNLKESARCGCPTKDHARALLARRSRVAAGLTNPARTMQATDDTRR